jgi:hypothetical protein
MATCPKKQGYICLDVGLHIGTQSKIRCFAYVVRILLYPPNRDFPGSHARKMGDVLVMLAGAA